MPDPPVPVVPAVLLAAAARLGWRVVTRTPSGAELGELYDPTTGAARSLVLGRGESVSAVVWALCDTAAAPPLGALLLSRQTGDVLRGGTSGADGSVLYQGHTYRLRFGFNGAQWTADALAV